MGLLAPRRLAVGLAPAALSSCWALPTLARPFPGQRERARRASGPALPPGPPWPSGQGAGVGGQGVYLSSLLNWGWASAISRLLLNIALLQQEQSERRELLTQPRWQSRRPAHHTALGWAQAPGPLPGHTDARSSRAGEHQGHSASCPGDLLGRAAGQALEDAQDPLAPGGGLLWPSAKWPSQKRQQSPEQQLVGRSQEEKGFTKVTIGMVHTSSQHPVSQAVGPGRQSRNHGRVGSHAGPMPLPLPQAGGVAGLRGSWYGEAVSTQPVVWEGGLARGDLSVSRLEGATLPWGPAGGGAPTTSRTPGVVRAGAQPTGPSSCSSSRPPNAGAHGRVHGCLETWKEASEGGDPRSEAEPASLVPWGRAWDHPGAMDHQPSFILMGALLPCGPHLLPNSTGGLPGPAPSASCPGVAKAAGTSCGAPRPQGCPQMAEAPTGQEHWALPPTGHTQHQGEDLPRASPSWLPLS